MKISTTGFVRQQLKTRLDRTKASVVKKMKIIKVLEKELAKLNKK